MTGTINGWSTEKLYQDLGIEYLRSRPWLRRLWLFHKTMPFPQNHLPIYLISVRNANTITPFKVRHDFFKKYCFPTVISKSKKLDLEIYHSTIQQIFIAFMCKAKSFANASILLLFLYSKSGQTNESCQ